MKAEHGFDESANSGNKCLNNKPHKARKEEFKLTIDLEDKHLEHFLIKNSLVQRSNKVWSSTSHIDVLVRGKMMQNIAEMLFTVFENLHTTK